MKEAEWASIVKRLNDSYPSQPISAATAAEWYAELAHLHAGDIWLAIRAHRREEPFRPSLAAILAGAAIQREDITLAVRAQRHADDQQSFGRRRGTPMPPETREAINVLVEATKLDTPADQRAEARRMADALADQLQTRLSTRTRPPETVADATRVCGACATSPQAGRVVVELPAGHQANPYPYPVVAYVPCPSCRPARHDARKRGRLADRTDGDGWVKAATDAGAIPITTAARRPNPATSRS